MPAGKMAGLCSERELNVMGSRIRGCEGAVSCDLRGDEEWRALDMHGLLFSRGA
jgi:hypothetical protein